ncbi:MAG TPA: hypothetical protein VIY86_13395 [Pirellulaceae bacterium]
MPLHNLGYRAWTGIRTWPHTAWWVIASTGVALAWKSRWLRRLVVVSWLPAAYLGLGIFAFEKAVEYPEWQGVVPGILKGLPGALSLEDVWDAPATSKGIDLAQARYRIWAFLLMTLFRYSQGTILLILVGLVATPLIGSDLRTRAFLLYFSKPLGVWEYLGGKSAVVGTYLALITAGPALALYVVGVLLSADLSVLQYTWDLPLRIVLASAVVMIPTTALALCVSSLFQDNRNAVFAWFAIWILGWVVYGNLAVIHGIDRGTVTEGWWSFFSLFHVLGSLQSWVFGLSRPESLIPQKAILVAVVTVIATIVLHRRAVAPTRI